MKTTLKLVMVTGLLMVGLLTSASSCQKFAMNFDGDYHYTETIQKTISFAGKSLLSIDNSVGTVQIEDGLPAAIELTATKKARSQADLDRVNLEFQEDAGKLRIHSVQPDNHSSRWAVDYVLKIPAGTRVEIDQGVGEIRITDHEGSLSIDLGVGDVRLESVRGDELSINLGVGDVDLVSIESRSVSASVGTGDLDVRLRPDASFTVSADVGLGDLTIKGFANMHVEREGFIAQSAKAVLGAGEGKLTLEVGVGDLDVRPLE